VPTWPKRRGGLAGCLASSGRRSRGRSAGQATRRYPRGTAQCRTVSFVSPDTEHDPRILASRRHFRLAAGVAVPLRTAHGKEGVDGSSPSEGFGLRPGGSRDVHPPAPSTAGTWRPLRVQPSHEPPPRALGEAATAGAARCQAPSSVPWTVSPARSRYPGTIRDVTMPCSAVTLSMSGQTSATFSGRSI
jgi:hypothetical protein